MTEREQGEGGRAFFLLAAVILGGLLFALGVMVGRATAPADPGGVANPLGVIDARDAKPVVADGDLEYPKALSAPPAPQARRNPPAVAKPAPQADPPPVQPKDGGGREPRREDGPDPAHGVAGRADAPSGPTYCLQVASFQRADQAEQLVAKLRGRGLPHVRTVSGEVVGKGTYYRVRVGRFAERRDAETLNDRASLEGLIIQSEE